MVNEILNNTFTSTTGSIWTVAEKNSSIVKSQTSSGIVGKNCTSIKIIPSKTITLTKIIINIQGINNISQNFTLNYSINSHKEVNIVKTKSVGILGAVITIDLNSNFASERSIGTNGFILFELNNKLDSNYTIIFNGYYNINRKV